MTPTNQPSTITRHDTTMPSLHASLLQGCLARPGAGATCRGTHRSTGLQAAAIGTHRPAACTHQPEGLPPSVLHHPNPARFKYWARLSGFAGGADQCSLGFSGHTGRRGSINLGLGLHTPALALGLERHGRRGAAG